MRITLIAAEPLFRLGFQTAIATSSDLFVAAEASDARAGFLVIDRDPPEVVVMALALPGMNGIAATREVGRRAPKTRVLLIADWARERDVLDGLAAGAAGFAVTTDPVETLLDAIRLVGAGHRPLPAHLRGLAASSRKAALPDDPLGTLSPREREVLDLVLSGWRNRDIARELCVSIKTVDTHRTHINRKLTCSNGSDLVRFAAENGLLRRVPPAIAANPQGGSDYCAAAQVA
jgi:DNA-binding NarL/FixJ family response regulator